MVKTGQQNDENTNEIFSEETIQSLVGLGEILRKIHNRILSEGYVFKDDQFIKVDEQADTTN